MILQCAPVRLSKWHWTYSIWYSDYDRKLLNSICISISIFLHLIYFYLRFAIEYLLTCHRNWIVYFRGRKTNSLEPGNQPSYIWWCSTNEWCVSVSNIKNIEWSYPLHPLLCYSFHHTHFAYVYNRCQMKIFCVVSHSHFSFLFACNGTR